MGGVFGRLMLGHAEAQRRQIDVGEHCFALPEHDGRKREMQLVDQAGAKVLAHRVDAATDLHVAAVGSELRLFQRRLDAIGHEDEGGAALHLDGVARMIGKHESRCVVRRVVAPPALPAFVRPGTADRTEHVAAEDEGTKAVHRTVGVGMIDALRAAVLTDHLPEHARAEKPVVQLVPTLAQRIFEALLRTCSEAIKRD